MSNFDTLLKRKYTNCTKWDALMRDFQHSDLLPFWVADADFPILPDIAAAIRRRAADTQTFGYTFAGDGFYNSIITWNRMRHSLELKKSEILPIPGVVTAIAMILMTLTEEGDRVLINPPVYHPFFSTILELKRELVSSDLILKDSKYQIDFTDLATKLASGIKVYLFCSPHNPIGRVWTADELHGVVELCRKYHVVLVSDEIHNDIIFSGHVHTPILNIMPEALMLVAPSKTFNIAGLKSSFFFTKSPELYDKVAALNSALHLYVNLFGLLATQVAYEKGAQWVDEMNSYLEKNARIVCDYLVKYLPGVKTFYPEGTYLMWLDFSAYNLSKGELRRRLIEDAGLALNPGEEFGTAWESFSRLNIATTEGTLLEGLERLRRGFGK